MPCVKKISWQAIATIQQSAANLPKKIPNFPTTYNLKWGNPCPAMTSFLALISNREKNTTSNRQNRQPISSSCLPDVQMYVQGE